MFCNEFILSDLRVFDNCLKVCEGCDHVFNLAADMGGMGFIQSNHGVIFYNNTMISFNMLEAARKAGIKRCVRDPGAGWATAHVGRAANVAVPTCARAFLAWRRAPPRRSRQFARRATWAVTHAGPNLAHTRSFFYASSACIYPEHAQVTTELAAGLKESDAWPAAVRDAARTLSVPRVLTCCAHRSRKTRTA